jgi:hypothetical protein
MMYEIMPTSAMKFITNFGRKLEYRRFMLGDLEDT